MELGLLLGAAALCIVCQAFFAASEIALVAADGLKVRAEHESGIKESHAVTRMLERRDRMVALMLTGNNLATVIAAAAFTTFLHEVNPRAVDGRAFRREALEPARFATRPLARGGNRP
jgi:Mg2+/Co2+ transporter CorB